MNDNTNRKNSDMLRAAKALIDTPEKWIQRAYCNAETYDKSTCFCSLGAMNKVFGLNPWDTDTNRLTLAFGKVIPGGLHAIPMFNDNATHEQVMAKFDEAIALAEMEEAEALIGCKVMKRRSHKPFKSGLTVNTVKGVVPHPNRSGLAYTFVEDESCVAVNICVKAAA